MKRARDVREQLVGLMQRVEIEMVSNVTESTDIRKAITAGYFYHIARFSKGGSYKTVKHNQVFTYLLQKVVSLQLGYVLFHF